MAFINLSSETLQFVMIAAFTRAQSWFKPLAIKFMAGVALSARRPFPQDKDEFPI
ncbi:hypothetical protein HFC70_03200 [Agrobacterium sp. a22-2]|uniref:hypothetical protein n=1 Tax=Agrobacterium sp. a22-2 TaxID=2283840 RepID=UPI001445BA96|nr:hypothetical protein [Agrobacterium sp. a22-2]NKN35354.1 hypothetical protein [Agrobacterium sp. a22-2]